MEGMNENEMKQVALEKFAAIQRIKKYGKEELEYQEKLARAELHNLGISTEELELNEQAEKGAERFAPILLKGCEKMKKTKTSTRKAIDKYNEKFERMTVNLPLGTRAMIADTDLSFNAFANDAIERQLKALEMFDFEDDIKSMTPPKEINGKPVYNFVDERKYIKPGRWWHDVVFFWDDLELNDLFIRFMDEEEPGNDNYKDGCRIIFDIVDTARYEIVDAKYTDEELAKMTYKQLKKIPEIDFGGKQDNTDKLKRKFRKYLYKGDKQPLYDFLGVGQE